MGNEWIRSRIYRRTAGWTIGGAMAVVAIMALSPAALGAHANSTLLPPYAGSAAHGGMSLYSNCGTSAATATHWNGANGLVTGAAKESFTDCPSWFGEPQGSGSSFTTVAIPFHPTHISEYNASLTWTYKLADAFSVSGLACPGAINYTSGYDYEDCWASSQWVVQISMNLYDLTTSSYVGTTYNYFQLANYTEAYQDNYCYLGNCSTASGTYTGSSLYNYLDQYPGYDYGTAYLGAGSNSGTGSTWSNTTSWNPSTLTGTNITLFPTQKYVALVSIGFYAQGFEYRYSDIYTGSSYSFLFLNPAAGKGSSSVSAVPTSTSGAGVKLTSLTLTAV